MRLHRYVDLSCLNNVICTNQDIDETVHLYIQAVLLDLSLIVSGFEVDEGPDLTLRHLSQLYKLTLSILGNFS